MAAAKFIKLDPKKSNTVDIAKGIILMEYYQDKKNYGMLNDILKNLRVMGTEKGRAVQMFSILQRLSPMGMLQTAQAEIDEVLNEIARQKGNLGQKWLEDNRHKYDLTEDEIKYILDEMEKIKDMEGRDKAVAIGQIQGFCNKDFRQTGQTN